MHSIVCTLFEGHYHFGVAALVNSLYKNGFRGQIYAGYRGTLPSWAANAKENISLELKGGQTLEIGEGLQLNFIPLDTNYHLTNYKPDFMLDIWRKNNSEAKGIFYFDPDIVVSASWSLFEEWKNCGVTLCEDVNSPMAVHHPRRVSWRRYFGGKGFSLLFKDSIYANGGFVGVSKKNLGFIEIWKSIQEAMGLQIGGLNRSAFPGETLSKDAQSPFSPFGKTDQDALNAAIEAWDGEISFVGKEGMAFKAGTPLMLHALGQPKPWLRNNIIQAFKGNRLSSADKGFWVYMQGPIVTSLSHKIKIKKLSILVASLISRFYARN